MTSRLADKVAIVVGAGQTPGATIGNGRATALLFAREGATVIAVDRSADSVAETVRMIAEEGGTSYAVQADITREDDCRRIAATAREQFGRIDVLHNNVGVGAGDASALRLDEQVWRRIVDTNLTGMWLTCKHVLPVMREQGSGAVTNVSSVAAIAATPLFAYKVSKAGVNALTQQLAIANARHRIRVNAIMPGLMDTPMAVDAAAAARGVARAEVATFRDALVPLGGHQGTAWDVAYAALYLASDEARFVTGVLLPVDGGQSVKVG